MTKENRKITILGVGVMGGAILNGILTKKFCSGAAVTVYDLIPEKVRPFVDTFGVKAAASAKAAVQGAEVVVLAVKPQYINALMEEIAEELDVETLVISIAAGVSLSRLQEYLNTGNLIRVMPNTPAQIGSGVSGWIADRSVSEEDKAYVRSFLAQIGTEIEVRNEDQIDQVGAISGSGPAFVYLFMEAMIDTGVHMGMTREAVTELVVQTLIGSAEYLKARGEHPAVLRNEVTSPGGTTAEGLYYLERENFRSAIARCMWACYDRTRQLRNESARREKNLDIRA